jgi:osmotically inducible lipoprotein OsmB
MIRSTLSIRALQATVALAALVTLGGCANMSSQDRNTVGGAGIGAVAGAVLTGGSPIGTVGGAAVGGVIGNAISNPRR